MGLMINMKKKILLIAAGRRVSFAERLKWHGYQVYSFETDPQCPLANIGEVDVHCHDPSVLLDEVGQIVEICRKNDIQHILPLNDYWAANSRDITDSDPDLIIIGPGYTTANICYDKALLATFMRCPNLKYYYPSYKLLQDFVIKDRFGNGSKGVEFVHGARIDKALFTNRDTKVIQKRIYGTEYSVDAYFNRNGEMIYCLPRTRDRVAGGEVVDSKVVDPNSHTYQRLHIITNNIGNEIGYTGPACFQFIKGHDDRIYLIEINARFGGGCILSLQAGFDMIDLFTREYVWNEDISSDWYCSYHRHVNIGMKRVFEETFYNV
jgi:carbamoyl-phosphate synthase large subunit